MTLPAPSAAFGDALDTWCDLTGTAADAVDIDAEALAVVRVLAGWELLRFMTEDRPEGPMGRPWYDTHTARLELVLLAGGELAKLRHTPVEQATARVAKTVVEQLGQPTGYEGQPQLLARHIHTGTPFGNM